MDGVEEIVGLFWRLVCAILATARGWLGSDRGDGDNGGMF
jgi:hypothetical protein